MKKHYKVSISSGKSILFIFLFSLVSLSFLSVDEFRISLDQETRNLYLYYQSLLKTTNYEILQGRSVKTEIDKKAVSGINSPVSKSKPGPISNYLESLDLDKDRGDNTRAERFSVEVFSGQTIHYQGLSLDIPGEVLKKRTLIKASALNLKKLPSLAESMVNVTKSHQGYRLLPHGVHFKEPVSLSLDYDKSLIPEGYSEQDIKTYFYDEKTKIWKALPKDSLNLETESIVSLTDHFTDFIAGILKVPESPETLGYTPTSITDIQAADPGSGIQGISVSGGSSQGSSQSSFPLKVPASRNGMQPSLSVNYNSESGNSWMGQGWDLSLSGISIDTRWGVPRYDPEEESEIYTIDGSMLTPTSHRGEKQNRSTDKRFYPRKENNYSLITRKGNSPQNYYWIIENKSGGKTYYGGVTSLDPGSVLNDSQGNIAYWGLVRSEDSNGNTIHYTYDKTENPGVLAGNIGVELYLKEIRYTGRADQAGKYSIEFEREKSTRKDVAVSARLGFKQVTGDLLKKVTMYYDNQLIRSYEFEYSQGRFYKTLLKEIKEFDSQGKEFYKNTLEYFDDIAQAGGAYYTPAESIDIHDEDLKASLTPLGKSITLISGEEIGELDGTTAIGGNKNSGGSAGAYLGIGLKGSSSNKTNTVGGKYSYSQSKSEGLLSLSDIDADGLPDKIFRQNGDLYYRKNLGNNRFGSKKEIKGSKHLNKSKSKTHSFGIEVYYGPVFAGYQRQTTTTTTSIYMMDFNGDGLVDIVEKGTVYFNRINAQGYPEFTSDSRLSPSPIIGTSEIDESFLPDVQAEQEELINQNPLHDVVKMWVAPFSGEIQLNSQVQLLEDTTEEAQQYEHADGVLVSIQHNGTLLAETKTDISKKDYIPKDINLKSFQIRKADRLYFRVQSKKDGMYDQVNWDPEITYLKTTNHVPLTDVNNLNLMRYKASEDQVLSARQNIILPKTGKINITGNLIKGQTSDSITLQILKENSLPGTPPVYQRKFSGQELFNGEINLDLNVTENESYLFRMQTQSNIDWARVNWNPRLTYTTFSDGDPVLLPDGTPISVIYPVVDKTMFTTRIQLGETASPPANFTFTPEVPLIKIENQIIDRQRGSIEVVIKSKNRFIGSQKIYLYNKTIAPSSFTAHVPDLDPKEELYFEYYIEDSKTVELFDPKGTFIINGTPSSVYYKNQTPEFGNLYRGWGQFAYNGNKERAEQPIDESELNLDDYNDNVNSDIESLPEDGEELEKENLYDPNTANFIVMLPNAEKQVWQGADPMTYTTATGMSSSRRGIKDLSIDPVWEQQTIGFSGLSAITKKNKTISNSYSASVSVENSGGLSGSGSRTDSKTDYSIEMMDFNGDRYPDVVDDKKIQYTSSKGVLSSRTGPSLGNSHRNEGLSWGVTLGGTFVPGHSFFGGIASGGKGFFKSFNIKDPEDKSGDTSKGSIGLSGNFSKNTDETRYTWMDINGDGLPDKVRNSGMVELNTGYGFLRQENWGQSYIQEGKTYDYGAGVGYSSKFYSIAAGIGLGLSDTDSHKGLIDINGDGLLDMIDSDQVRLNTGSGFSESIYWPGLNKVSNSHGISESKNTSFTYCQDIWAIRICINPQISSFSGISREKIQIMDFNGDGYPDILSSKKDGSLKVAYSTIGKTNLLKKVNNYLGSEITLNYKQEGNTYESPGLKWVLSEVEIYDGHSKDGADRMKTQFDYKDNYYDRNERQSYGFAQVKTHQIDTETQKIYRTTTENYYNRDYYRSGILKNQFLEDSQGVRYTESQSVYEIKDAQSNTVISEESLKSMEKRIFISLKQENSLLYEGTDDPLRTTTTYQYDKIGNIVQYTSLGDGSAEQKVEAKVEYSTIESPYFVGIPTSITLNTNQGIKRRTGGSIDPITGNVTEIKQYLENGQASVYSFEYDEYGNRIKVTGPENTKGERMWNKYIFDSQTHSFITQIEDAFGYSSQAVYDYRFGALIETTDKNQQKIRYELDSKARLSTVTGPNELAAGKPYTLAFEYHPEAPVPFARTRHYDPEHEKDIETYSFTDGLGRAVQVKKTASLFSKSGGKDKDGFIVSGKMIYDPFGRIIESYYPVTEEPGKETQYNPGVDEIAPSRVKYDILDRPLESTLADGSLNKTAYSLDTYKQNKTTKTEQTDALGNKAESLTDALGRNILSRQYSAGGNIDTQFEYNALGELLSVTDVKGNKTLSQYDNLGRRTQLIHPDAGKIELKYDSAGNMTEKITAQIAQTIPDGGAIKYKYKYNRLEEISYPKNYQNNVTYTYGEPGASHNRAGRMVLITDNSGGKELFYGKLGETIKEIQTVRITQTNIQTYVSEYQYDSWNRIQTMIYPDGEKLTYTYNRAGNLHSLQGEKLNRIYPYINQLGYDKFEQRTYLQYGNGTETHYNYEPQRRRLSTMKVSLNSSEAGASGIFINNSYGYDKVSNVLSVENTAPVLPNSIGGKTRHKYQYDDLYRLIKAEGEFTGTQGPANYTLEMKYDPTHNILQKKQSHYLLTENPVKSNYQMQYSYQSDKPHALKGIQQSPLIAGLGESRSYSYSYDQNGNMTGYTYPEHYREILWDEENRMQAVNDDGFVSLYTYNHSGERVLKSSGTTQGVFVNGANIGSFGHEKNYTGYLNPYFVFKAGSFTKHIYAGDQRIVSQIGNGTFNTNSGLNGNGITAGNINFAKQITYYDQQMEQYISSLGIPPGPPHLKGIYGSPEYTGKAYPDFGTPLNKDNEPPLGWPKVPVFNKPGDVPGPPVQWGDDITNDNVEAGWGYDGTGVLEETDRFFYHPDHLGSTAYVTTAKGRISQHIEYIPFGETLIEEHTNSWQTPYKFNAKEFDSETGLGYYGARYYSPRESVWISVDPLAEKYPNISPYAYAFLNPVKYIDPDGEEPTPAEAARMSAHVYGDGTKLIGGWKVSSKVISGVSYNNTESGFKSQMYERTVGGVTEYTYATAGTEFTSGKDWGANAKQAAGMSKQYKISIGNAINISDKLGSSELTFVGHSKGGGQAAANSMATGRRALTFNAAGVSNATKSKYFGWGSLLKSYNDIIDAFIMTTDPLNKVQNNSEYLPSVDGTRHSLSPANASGYYNGHSINSVIDHYDAEERASYQLTPQQKAASDAAQQQFNINNIKW